MRISDTDLFFRRPLYVLCALTVAAFILYGQTLNAPFVYDDHELLLQNPLIKDIAAPLEGWQTAGTKLVAFLTFAVNYAVGAEHSFGYHFISLILHTLNSWLMYLLIILFFKTPRLMNASLSSEILAFIAAMIFLCHPIQTQAVSHIWQRSELLNAFFYLLTLLFYLRGRIGEGKGYFVFAAFFFVLGFYSKGMIVSFPLLALLLEDALFDVPKEKRVFLRTCGILTILGLLLFWHIKPIDDFRASLIFGFRTLTGTLLTPTHLYTQVDVIARYIVLTIFPVMQNLDHTVPLVSTFWHPRILMAAVFIGFVISVGIQFWKKDRLAALGIFWFFIALLPSSLLGGREPMVEHRLYFALGGFSLLGASLLVKGFERKAKYGWFAVIFVALLSLLTLTRNHLWQSPRLLFEDTVRKSPTKARPAIMLGTVYMTQNRLEDAEELFVRSIRLDPASPESYNNLGLIYLQTGRAMQAETMFEKAIAVRKDFAPAYINLGYFVLGIGDDDRAEEMFRKALTLGKSDAALVGLGNLSLTRGHLAEAVDLLEQAVASDPRNYKAYIGLGDVYFAQRDDPEAIDHYQKAVSLKPDLTEAYLRMSRAYSRRGDFENARWALEKAKALE